MGSGAEEAEVENLYWKTQGQTRTLIPKPFDTETAFEAYVYKNQDLLGDIYIIHRQIRTGNKQGIPDMLGVDQNARICIIEMKNTEVDESILPQVLSYAMWAETNPDSIKAIWLESQHKPEDIEIEWDNLEVRAIVVAPSFRPTVLRMASKIGYQIDLVQVQRFSFEQDEFLLVEVMAEEPSPRIKTTTAMQEWDWEYYEKEHGKDAVAQFRSIVDHIDEFAHKQEWSLPYNLNKGYTGFKFGNRVIFGVHWAGTHAWNVRLKLPKEVAEGFTSPHWEFQRFDADFREVLIRPKDRKNAPMSEIETLLEAAYKHASVAS